MLFVIRVKPNGNASHETLSVDNVAPGFRIFTAAFSKPPISGARNGLLFGSVGHDFRGGENPDCIPGKPRIERP